MKFHAACVSAILLFALPLMGQVVPAHPTKFKTRDIGDASTGGIQVIPPGGTEPRNARYITHIVLSVSRQWQSTDGKLVEGKLIAFEDLVVEAEAGAAPPASQTPPAHPTVVRDGKVRLLIKQKPIELAITRLSSGDQEFIQQTQKSYGSPTPK
jgi:hypothetical protein